jgi:hypothetical protein
MQQGDTDWLDNDYDDWLAEQAADMEQTDPLRDVDPPEEPNHDDDARYETVDHGDGVTETRVYMNSGGPIELPEPGTVFLFDCGEPPF